MLPPHEASLGLYLHNLCLQQGFLPDVAYQVNEPQTLLALVAEGCGITLLPDSYGRIPWPGVRFARCNRRRRRICMRFTAPTASRR